VAKRNALHKAGQQEAADRAQKWVLKYYGKMYERGYFRNSYNSSNLLWLFDLSWWQDVLEVLVGKDGKMRPRNAKRFLQMLADREPVFEANLKKVKPARGETRAERAFNAHSEAEAQTAGSAAKGPGGNPRPLFLLRSV